MLELDMSGVFFGATYEELVSRLTPNERVKYADALSNIRMAGTGDQNDLVVRLTITPDQFPNTVKALDLAMWLNSHLLGKIGVMPIHIPLTLVTGIIPRKLFKEFPIVRKKPQSEYLSIIQTAHNVSTPFYETGSRVATYVPMGLELYKQVVGVSDEKSTSQGQ